jgi:hypothetical protein
MEWYQFITHASALFFKPFKAFTELFYRYRKKIFGLGLLASVIGNVAYIVSGILLSQTGIYRGLGFVISSTIFTLILDYVLIAVALALFYMVLGFMGAKTDIREFAGAYLVSEFPLIALLPISILVRALPQASWSYVFPVFKYALLLMTVLLKAKAISVTANITEVKSIGILLIPIAFLIFTLSVTVIFFSVFIANLIV